MVNIILQSIKLDLRLICGEFDFVIASFILGVCTVRFDRVERRNSNRDGRFGYTVTESIKEPACNRTVQFWIGLI